MRPWASWAWKRLSIKVLLSTLNPHPFMLFEYRSQLRRKGIMVDYHNLYMFYSGGIANLSKYWGGKFESSHDQPQDCWSSGNTLPSHHYWQWRYGAYGICWTHIQFPWLYCTRLKTDFECMTVRFIRDIQRLSEIFWDMTSCSWWSTVDKTSTSWSWRSTMYKTSTSWSWWSNTM